VWFNEQCPVGDRLAHWVRFSIESRLRRNSRRLRISALHNLHQKETLELCSVCCSSSRLVCCFLLLQYHRIRQPVCSSSSLWRVRIQPNHSNQRDLRNHRTHIRPLPWSPALLSNPAAIHTWIETSYQREIRCLRLGHSRSLSRISSVLSVHPLVGRLESSCQISHLRTTLVQSPAITGSKEQSPQALVQNWNILHDIPRPIPESHNVLVKSYRIEREFR